MSNKTWQERVADQGVSTALLFALVYGMYVHVPSGLEMIQRGYDRNAASLSADVGRMESVVNRLLTWVERSVMVTEELDVVLKENQRLIEESNKSLNAVQDHLPPPNVGK